MKSQNILRLSRTLFQLQDFPGLVGTLIKSILPNVTFLYPMKTCSDVFKGTQKFKLEEKRVNLNVLAHVFAIP